MLVTAIHAAIAVTASAMFLVMATVILEQVMRDLRDNIEIQTDRGNVQHPALKVQSKIHVQFSSYKYRKFEVSTA
jgi:chloramphenicol 3-O-phosphotransferase